MTCFSLPKWYDLHTHLRQDALLPVTIAHHLQGQCAGVLAMPNTKPPVAKIMVNDPLPHHSIEGYLADIRAAGGGVFDQIIVPLYLTADTTPGMIAAGAKSGLLKACKYYPPHGTTNAAHGCPLQHFIDNGVLQTMADHGVVLCIHGEVDGLGATDYFDKARNAEVLFYQQQMPVLYDKVPGLKIVCEHITTAVAVDFVKTTSGRVAATITPQHLIYTIGSLLRKLNYHLYCMPVVKFAEDRQALQDAVLDPNNQYFFAGTDSAPHTEKATECGCAAGCYSAPVAPQLYAEAFELAGADLTKAEGQQLLCRFLCDIGPTFYGLPIPSETFTLARIEQTVEAYQTPAGKLQPLPLGNNPQQTQLHWSIVS